MPARDASGGGIPPANLDDGDTDLNHDTAVSDPPAIKVHSASLASQRAATMPGGQRAPMKALARTDIVPELRRDLKIVRISGGIQITSPIDGQVHDLNEVEASLARMLDGKRAVSEMLDASERLGIPADVLSLHKFITQLDIHGFLQPPETLDSGDSSAWPSRGQWEKSVRKQFQTGIKCLRMGKMHEAIEHFEALLVEDPNNEEASELLAMAREALAAPIKTIVVPGPPSYGYSPTPSGPMPVVMPPPESPISATDPAFEDQPSFANQEGVAAPPAPQARGESPTPVLPQAPPGSNTLLVIILTVLVIIGAALGYFLLRK